MCCAVLLHVCVFSKLRSTGAYETCSRTHVFLQAPPICKYLLTAETKPTSIHQVSAQAIVHDILQLKPPSRHDHAVDVLTDDVDPRRAPNLLETGVKSQCTQKTTGMATLSMQFIV